MVYPIFNSVGSREADNKYIRNDLSQGFNLTQKLQARNNAGVPTLDLFTPIIGFPIANDVSDANNDISIGAGKCISSDGAYFIVANALKIKQTDAIFAEGSGVGCMDQHITQRTTTNRARNGSNVATLTLNSTTGLVTGMTVRISNVGGTGYNGQFVITVAGSTVTYTNIGSLETTQADTNGRLDTSKGANSVVSFFTISKEDATSDILGSLCPDVPLMPSGYTYKRLLGSAVCDGSGNIRAGTWTRINGNQIDFTLKANVLERANAAISNTNRQTLTTSIPPNCWGKFLYNSYSSDSFSIWIMPTSFTDAVPTGSNGLSTWGGNESVKGDKVIQVDASSMIAFRQSAITASQFHMSSYGYTQIL